jgi:hypothetical protein
MDDKGKFDRKERIDMYCRIAHEHGVEKAVAFLVDVIDEERREKDEMFAELWKYREILAGK